MRELPWLPLDPAELLAMAAHLPDYQRGWFYTLLFACAVSPRPGYLRIGDTESVWKLTGARRSQSFTERSAAVLAAFNFADIDGEKYLYHPRLKEIIDGQLHKVRQKRRSADISTDPQVSTDNEQLSLSLLSVVKKKEKRSGEPFDDSEEMWAFRVQHALKTQGSVTGELAKWAERLGIETKKAGRAGKAG